MKEYEIWIEGYAATGEHSPASFIGKSKGDNFEDACKNFEYPENIMSFLGDEIIIHKGDKLKLDTHYPYPSIWACILYDNETDARKSFG